MISRAALDPVLQDVVRAAALRGERFVSISRIVFCTLVLARFVSVTPLELAPYALNLFALALAVLCSFWILRRIATQRAGYGTLYVSILVDAAVCGTSLLQTCLWPYQGAEYRGLLAGPDVAALLVVVYAAGLRVWPRLAVLGSGLNLLAYAGLVSLELRLRPDRLAYGHAEIALFSVCLIAVMALSIVTAQRSLNLLTAGAQSSVQVDRARRQFAELVRDHHDARSVLSAAALASDRMVRAIDDSRPVDSVRRHAERLREDVAVAKSRLASLGDRAYDHLTTLGELQVVDAEAVLGTAVLALRSHFPDVPIELEATGAELPQAVIVGGAACLQRIVYNLVSNAREGDGQRGATRVVLRLAPGGGGLQLHVDDDGPGFTQAALDSGGVMPASTKPTGLGFGLLMTRELVRASGGKVETANLAEGGARVTVTLPTAHG